MASVWAGPVRSAHGAPDGPGVTEISAAVCAITPAGLFSQARPGARWTHGRHPARDGALGPVGGQPRGGGSHGARRAPAGHPPPRPTRLTHLRTASTTTASGHGPPGARAAGIVTGCHPGPTDPRRPGQPGGLSSLSATTPVGVPRTAPSRIRARSLL